MKSQLLTAVLSCALAAACTGLGTGSTSPQLSKVGRAERSLLPIRDRKAAPDLSGTTLDAQHLDVADLKGKVVVLNFWASWCAQCRAEASTLNAVYAQTRALGVAFVGVDIKDDVVAARAFTSNKYVPYGSLYDQEGLLLLRFRDEAPQSPPTTLILDRQGRVAARFLEAVTTPELLGPIRAVAAEVS